MKTEHQLIQETLEGKQNAFAELVKRYQDQMYSVCLSILKSSDEAQEATQDTFIKMYKSLDKYNAESKLSTWLYRIAYRTSLDYIRKRKPTQDIEDVHSDLNTTENEALESLENESLKRNLEIALAKLKPDEAALIRMFYLEEMKIKELEEVTGLSTSNIKVKLFRARKKLSEIIKNEFAEIESFLLAD